MEGHVLSDALVQSSSIVQRARVAEIAQIGPLVSALTSDSQHQTGS
jgi:hypothetical protein